jgi:ABC-type transporter Mla subunit MlaD
MTQMSETAGSSVAGLSAALTTAVSDMSSKATELSEKMSNSMATSTQRTAGAVHAVVEEAGTWTAKTAEQLNQLIERHQRLVGSVEDVSLVMDGTIAQLKESLPQLMTVSKELRAAAAEINNASSRTAQAAVAMQTVQDAVAKTAGYSQTQVEALSQTARQIQDDMRQYLQMFERIRAESGQLLTQIGQNLRSYTEVSRNGFEGILKSANEQMGTAVQSLNGSIGELDEYLQQLNEVLEMRVPKS